MIHQLFIKLFIVLFVLNVTALGIIYDNIYLSYLGLLNLLLLVIVLFQHRSAIKKMTAPGKRTLFTPSVFFLICIFVGLFAWITVDISFWDYLHISKIVGSVGLGLLTYVASYVLFQMDNEDSGWKLFSRFLFGVLLLGCLRRVGTMLGKVSGLGIFTDMFSREDAGKVTVSQEVEKIQPGIRIEDIVNKEEKENPLYAELQVPPQERFVMTYADLIPTVINRYELGDALGSYSFANIESSSPLYSSFARARDLGMIGTDISPTRQVKCKNLMVIIGLAEGWNISTVNGVFNAYWTEASSKGLISTCGTQEDVAFTDYFGTTP